MEAETITQLIAVGGTLGGALIAAGVTLASQLITKKYENEKLKKQLEDIKGALPLMIKLGAIDQSAYKTLNEATRLHHALKPQ